MTMNYGALIGGYRRPGITDMDDLVLIKSKSRARKRINRIKSLFNLKEVLAGKKGPDHIQGVVFMPYIMSHTTTNIVSNGGFSFSRNQIRKQKIGKIFNIEMPDLVGGFIPKKLVSSRYSKCVVSNNYMTIKVS